MQKFEHQLGVKITQWTELMVYKYPELKYGFFHIPNEGKRAPWKVKAGIKAGVLDYIIACPRGKYHGFWLEIKAPGKKPTEAQLDMMVFLAEQDYFVCWTDDFNEAIQYISDYMDGKL